MRKILLLLCICILSSHMLDAQTTRETNIYKYAGTKDCNKLIPIYGKPNKTLVLKVYPAQQYMGSWMKSSEYPDETYIATYDGNGLLTNVDNENKRERSVYTYSYNVLSCITLYDRNTGSKLSTECPAGPDYDKRGKKRITDNNTYFTVWFNTNKVDDGLWISCSACAPMGNVYYIHKNNKYFFRSIDLRKKCGLSWVNHTRESDPYNPVTMLNEDNLLWRNSSQYDANGIPMKNLQKYVDVVSCNNYLVYGYKYYEYTWSL